MLFACVYVLRIFQPENLTGWGSEGVNFNSLFLACEKLILRTPGCSVLRMGDLLLAVV